MIACSGQRRPLRGHLSANLDVLHLLLAFGELQRDRAADELFEKRRIEPFAGFDIGERGEVIRAGGKVPDRESAVGVGTHLLNAPDAGAPEGAVRRKRDDVLIGRRPC